MVISFLLSLPVVQCWKSKFLILQDFQQFSERKPDIEINFPHNLRELAISNVFHYAEYHGYDYRLLSIDRLDFFARTGLYKSWSKVFALYNAMKANQGEGISFPFFDYVVYIDSSNYLIEMPQMSLDEQLRTWNPLVNIYLSYYETSLSPLAGIDQIPQITEVIGSGFQIWKNTAKNQDLLRKWLLITKLLPEIRSLKTSFPYEANALLSFVVPYLTNCSHFISFQKIPTFPHSSSSSSSLFSTFEINSLSISQRLTLRDRLISSCYLLLTLPSKLGSSFHCPSSSLTIQQPSLHRLIQQKVFNLKNNDYHLYQTTPDFSLFSPATNLQLLDVINQHINSLTHQPENGEDSRQLTETSEAVSGHFYSSKTIVTLIVSGIRQVELALKYWNTALHHNIIQEIHIWHLSSDVLLHQHLVTQGLLPGITVYSRYPLSFQETDYYDFYIEYSKYHDNDIIIKCDDNIVFLFIFKLPYFVDLVRENSGLLLPNTLLDDNMRFHQQATWNIFPLSLINTTTHIDPDVADELTHVHEEKTRSLLNSYFYFLKNWKEIIRPSLVPSLSYLSPSTLVSPVRRTNDMTLLQDFFNDRKFKNPSSTAVKPSDSVYYLPELLHLSPHMSPSFFGVKASNWVNQISSVSLSNKSEPTSYLLTSNFLICKLHSSQISTSLSIPILLLLTNLYSKLSDSYLQQHMNDDF
jgi:hypothetical protein